MQIGHAPSGWDRNGNPQPGRFQDPQATIRAIIRHQPDFLSYPHMLHVCRRLDAVPPETASWTIR
jgi:hypothetical protein